MELTTDQIAILTVLAFCQLIAMGLPYWAGRNTGWRRGNAHGYRTGYDAAEDKFETELNETAARNSSAERLLRATAAELRQMKDRHARELQNAREAYEMQSLKLADAQVLNEQHARLLHRCAQELELAASTWTGLLATRKADEARAKAGQLRDLAGWLKPQSQPFKEAA
ncbi:MAG: hypothetical protein NDI93_01105 [Pseudomonas sp.]|nr:hypothetical protein [Pseudomonas sp.]